MDCQTPKKLASNVGEEIRKVSFHSIVNCPFCWPAIDIVRMFPYLNEDQKEALKKRLLDKKFRSEILDAMEKLSGGDQAEIWSLLEEILESEEAVHNLFFKNNQ